MDRVRPGWRQRVEVLEGTLHARVGAVDEIDPGLTAQLKSIGYLGED